MLDIIEEVNLDLNRCERVLRENDYMEIVIAIEELQDKYKDKIKKICENESNNVWNYNRKDLEEIEKRLIDYKEEIILKEKSKNIYEKLEDLKIHIKDNNMKYKRDVEDIINTIEEVNNKDLNLDEKYEEIKECFSLLKNLDRKSSIYALELIALVIQ